MNFFPPSQEKASLSYMPIGKSLWKIHSYKTLKSTQEKALFLLQNKEHTPFLVMAYSQTEGKGQWDRKWHSPPGHFYGSFVLESSLWPQPLGYAALVGGLSVLLTLKEKLSPQNLSLSLKWPNDVLIEGLKVAGILCEISPPCHMIMGIGVNLGPLKDHPPTATSLKNYGIQCSPLSFLEALLTHLEQIWHQWLHKGAENLLHQCLNYGLQKP